MRNEPRNRAWWTLACFVLVHQAIAHGQQPPTATASAPKLVREANELLLNDKPAEALRSYEQAQELKPDAREIAFDQGLAHYRLGELEKAREAFTRAAGGAADTLADDAVYGLGTCDHAEALTAEDPKEAVGKIENAMRHYQSVLGSQRDHAAARDANLKAASYWRQLKQQMQQQQQQQDQNQESQEQDEEQKQDQQQQQSQQEQQESEQKQQDQQQQQQDQQKEQDKQEQQEQEQEASAREEKSEEEEKSAEEKEEASREQAERKLREMMQAMRDRKKHRREETKTPTFRPTEKDW